MTSCHSRPGRSHPSRTSVEAEREDHLAAGGPGMGLGTGRKLLAKSIAVSAGERLK